MKITPNIFQEEALIELSKTKKDKGVIVMPTGTGKTFLASLWFKKQLEENPKAKLLFICHNKDILSQANEREFQIHLKDFTISYGYYNAIEKNIEQVTFATTQTLARNLEKFPKDYFDYVIVDECHHYQARTFRKVIKYFKPKFMLGLTATPNRMDMKNIFTLLGEPIYTAKIFEAIKKGLLSKISYYAVDNDIDFSDIEWNGYKYSEEDLNKKLCVKKYDDSILKEYEQHIKNKRKKTICFCASVEHCYRMEDLFKKNGIKAVALTGKYKYKGIRRTNHHKKRAEIIKDFRSDGYDIIFVRDLFNEGVDIPIADCVMMLRPTMSSTIYTQQIGRGLRKYKDKKDLLILDFTGNANKSELNINSMSDMLDVDITEEIKKKLKKTKKKEQIMIVTEGGKIRLNKTKLKFFDNYFSKVVRPSKEELIKHKEDIIKYYLNGMSQIDLGKKYGFNRGVIIFFLKKWGVLQKLITIHEKRREDIIKDYKKGLSQVSISKRYNINRAYIVSILKKDGQWKSVYNEHLENVKKQLIKDYKNGKTTQELTKKYNATSRQSLIKKLHQWGISKIDRTRIKFNEEEKQKIIEDYKIMNLQQISKKYGYDVSTIRTRFNKWGIEKNKINKKKFIIFNKKEILEDYKSGINRTGLSKKHGCSWNFINNILDEEKIKIRGKNRIFINSEDKQKIIKDYNNGIARIEIAKKYKLTDTTIERRLNEWGIPRRQKNAVMDDYKSGDSLFNISNKNNISIHYIKKFLKDNQIIIRTGQEQSRMELNKKRDADFIDIVNDYNNTNCSVVSLSKKYGKSRATITKYFKDNLIK